MRLTDLVSDPRRFERLRAYAEMFVNFRLLNERVDVGQIANFDDRVRQFSEEMPSLGEMIRPGGEAEQAIHSIRAEFQAAIADMSDLPYPAFFNADISLALLCYAFTREIRPRRVVETGVGYGLSSAIILRALERNGGGKLISIDLPSSADFMGNFAGLAAASDRNTERWSLHLGTSRRHLPRILSQIGEVDVFISDSANVYTLQRYELQTVLPSLANNGVALFNNIGARFLKYASSRDDVHFEAVRQTEKTTCATGIFRKRQA